MTGQVVVELDATLLALLLVGIANLATGLFLAAWRIRDAQVASQQKDKHDLLQSSDGALQAIVVAKMALDLGDIARARSALDEAIQSTSGMIDGLADPDEVGLQRNTAADATPETSSSSTISLGGAHASDPGPLR